MSIYDRKPLGKCVYRRFKKTCCDHNNTENVVSNIYSASGGKDMAKGKNCPVERKRRLRAAKRPFRCLLPNPPTKQKGNSCSSTTATILCPVGDRSAAMYGGDFRSHLGFQTWVLSSLALLSRNRRASWCQTQKFYVSAHPLLPLSPRLASTALISQPIAITPSALWLTSTNASLRAILLPARFLVTTSFSCEAPVRIADHQRCVRQYISPKQHTQC